MKNRYYTISIIINIICIPIVCLAAYQRIKEHYEFKRIQAEKLSAAKKKEYPSYYYKNSPFYNQRISMFEIMPAKKNAIVFLGNSITEYCQWGELFQNLNVVNRGIGGDNTEGLYERLDQIIRIKPSKIFIMIGTNDLTFDYSIEQIIRNYEKIVLKIKKETPETKLYLESVLPRRDETKYFQMVYPLDKAIEQLALKDSCTYIDLYSHFIDDKGMLKKELTNDGIHLLGPGYQIWKSVVAPYVK